MAGRIVTEMKEWTALQKHYDEIKNVTLKDLFESDARRGHALAIDEGDIYFDYSKHRISDTTVKLLLNLARARGLNNEIERMFRGEKINETEGRAALHVALRNVLFKTRAEFIFCVKCRRHPYHGDHPRA
jgi:glucose-6-phosphate isomerase